MGLVERARQDAATITSNLEHWGVEFTITDPITSETATIAGTNTKHHNSIDADGNKVHAKIASVTFAESVLLAENEDYPIRDVKGEVMLRDHRVDIADSTGVVCNYVIREWFPDESLGLIVCVLGDFE